MSCLETFATLRIFSEALHPDEIERVLGVSGTSKNARDSSSPYRHRRETHGWFLTTEDSVQSEDNRVHLETLIALLLPRVEALHHLQSLGCKTDIFCYWISSGQGGPELDLEMIQHLCSLRLPIGWDMYFGSEEEYL
jgi:hypothetical protein